MIKLLNEKIKKNKTWIFSWIPLWHLAFADLPRKKTEFRFKNNEKCPFENTFFISNFFALSIFFRWSEVRSSQIISDLFFWRSSCLDLTLSQIIENCTLYCILIHQSFQIDLFRIKITNTNEIVLNSEFLDAKLFNEMQAQSARCRIIRFMSNRDYLGYQTNYQWD